MQRAGPLLGSVYRNKTFSWLGGRRGGVRSTPPLARERLTDMAGNHNYVHFWRWGHFSCRLTWPFRGPREVKPIDSWDFTGRSQAMN